MTSLEKLLSIGSVPWGADTALVNLPDLDAIATLGGELRALLRCRNGLYAFESALHVFPSALPGKEMNLRDWNAFNLWRFEYGDLAKGALFFAEDAFGNQFSLFEERVCFFEAETGELTEFSNDLETWAGRVLSETRLLQAIPYSMNGKRKRARWRLALGSCRLSDPHLPLY